jgi:hypothetical protein
LPARIEDQVVQPLEALAVPVPEEFSRGSRLDVDDDEAIAVIRDEQLGRAHQLHPVRLPVVLRDQGPRPGRVDPEYAAVGNIGDVEIAFRVADRSLEE